MARATDKPWRPKSSGLGTSKRGHGEQNTAELSILLQTANNGIFRHRGVMHVHFVNDKVQDLSPRDLANVC